MSTETYIRIAEGIAALATVFTFLVLFRRDKDKQRQIEEIKQIAKVLESQNEILTEQNLLFSQQVDILNKSNSLKIEDNAMQKELITLEDRRHKLSIKPILWTNGGGYSGSTGEFHLDLSNKGETAIVHEIKNNSDDVDVYQKAHFELEKGASTRINGRQNGDTHIQYCKMDLDVIYVDRLGNKYSSKIQGEGIRVSITDTREL